MNAVLILNQDYTPLMVCSVQRAFLLVFLKKAEMIDTVKNKQLRSISQTFPFPSVIKISRYISIPYNGVVLSRQNIFKRDAYECQYCGSGKDLTLDHVTPRSKNGESTWTNLVTACKSCNSKKGDFSPKEAGMKLKNRPGRPSYISFLRTMNGTIRHEWTPYLSPKKFSA